MTSRPFCDALVGFTAAAALCCILACGGEHVSQTEPPTVPNSPGTPGPPASIAVLSGDRQTVTVASFLANPIRLKVLDSAGRGVPGVDVSLIDTANVTLARARTDTSGAVSLTGLQVGIRSGDEAWTAVAATNVRVTLHETAIADAPAAIAAAPSPPDSLRIYARSYAGATLPPFALLVLDKFGNPTPGVSVSLSDNTGGSINPSPATTDSSGATPPIHWTLRATLGADTLQAKAGSVTTTRVSTVLSGPPASISVDLGGDQIAAAGGTITGVNATVRDASGRPVSGAAVTWTDQTTGTVICTRVSSSGSVNFTTDFPGCAWQLGARAGTYVSTLSSGAASATVTGHALAQPGAIRVLNDPTKNGYFPIGTAVPDDVVVQLLLPDGSPAAGYAVAFDPVAREATPSSPGQGNATTDAQGIARFHWVLPQVPDAYALHVIVVAFPNIDDHSIGVVVYGPPPLVAIAGGDAHTCGMMQTFSPGRHVVCWGRNAEAELADGTLAQRLTPIAATLDLPDRSTTIVARGGTTCAEYFFVDVAPIATHLFCWGANETAQAGTSTRPAAPTDVGSHLGDPTLGTTHACAFSEDIISPSHDEFSLRYTGVLCWGDNDPKPNAVQGPLNLGNFAFNAGDISAGDRFTCLTNADGHVLCWGRNSDGQLGDGTTSDHASPLPVTTTVVFQPGRRRLAAGIAHVCAIATDGLTYCWGRNDAGQLGDGSFTSRSTPTAVATTARFISLTAGAAHTCGLTATGAVYCWGSNDHGQLGNSFAGGASSVAFPVAGSVIFTQVVAGARHTCAIAKSDASPYCWGSNSDGQLGDGTTMDRFAPTRVGDYRPPPISSPSAMPGVRSRRQPSTPPRARKPE